MLSKKNTVSVVMLGVLMGSMTPVLGMEKTQDGPIKVQVGKNSEADPKAEFYSAVTNAQDYMQECKDWRRRGERVHPDTASILGYEVIKHLYLIAKNGPTALQQIRSKIAAGEDKEVNEIVEENLIRLLNMVNEKMLPRLESFISDIGKNLMENEQSAIPQGEKDRIKKIFDEAANGIRNLQPEAFEPLNWVDRKFEEENTRFVNDFFSKLSVEQSDALIYDEDWPIGNELDGIREKIIEGFQKFMTQDFMRATPENGMHPTETFEGLLHLSSLVFGEDFQEIGREAK